MNETVRQALNKLMARHGLSLARDSRRCDAWLRDLCPAHQKEVKVLVDAMKGGVVSDLLASGDSSPAQVLVLRQVLVFRLTNNTGIPPDLALWCVESWAFALKCATELMPGRITTKYIVLRVNIKHQPDANSVDICHQLEFTYDGDNASIIAPEVVAVQQIGYSAPEIGADHLVVLKAKVEHEPGVDPVDPCYEVELSDEAVNSLVSNCEVIEVCDIQPSVLLEVTCPSCHTGNIVVAAGEEECGGCSLVIECGVWGEVSIVSTCPNCGRKQPFDTEHREECPEEDEAGDLRPAWLVQCRHCNWGFKINANGKGADDGFVETDCPHCDNHFNVPAEPVQEPLKVRCPKCDGTFSIDKNGDFMA